MNAVDATGRDELPDRGGRDDWAPISDVRRCRCRVVVVVVAAAAWTAAVEGGDGVECGQLPNRPIHLNNVLRSDSSRECRNRQPKWPSADWSSTCSEY